MCKDPYYQSRTEVPVIPKGITTTGFWYSFIVLIAVWVIAFPPVPVAPSKGSAYSKQFLVLQSNWYKLSGITIDLFLETLFAELLWPKIAIEILSSGQFIIFNF